MFISPPAFAVAGMAGGVGGSTGAAMVAIVMIFEMTLDYNVIVPTTITVAISYGLRKVLSRESIYTMKLVRRGHYLPEALQTNPHGFRRAKELMLKDFGGVPASTTLKDFAKLVSPGPGIAIFLVEEGQHIIGFVRSTAALKVLRENEDAARLGDLADRNFIIVTGETAILDVIARMQASDAKVAGVADGSSSVLVSKTTGLISRQSLVTPSLTQQNCFVIEGRLDSDCVCTTIRYPLF